MKAKHLFFLSIRFDVLTSEWKW